MCTPLVRGGQGSTQQGPPSVSRHKVIDHVPLRDQEFGRGNKKNWRERAKEPEWTKDSVSGHSNIYCINILI